MARAGSSTARTAITAAVTAEDIEMTEVVRAARVSTTAIATAEDIEMTTIGGGGSSTAIAPGVANMEVTAAEQTAASTAIAPVAGTASTSAANTTAAGPLAKFLGILKNNLSLSNTLGMGTVYFTTQNGVRNLAEFIYAAGIGQTNASQAELEKEQKAAFLVIQAIGEILQIIMTIAAMNYALKSAEGETLVKKLLGKLLNGKILNLPNLLLASRGAQGVGGLVSTGVEAKLAYNSAIKAELTKEQADTSAQLTRSQTLTRAANLYEQKELALFASQLEQQVEELKNIIKHTAEGEREAARILQETAV